MTFQEFKERFSLQLNDQQETAVLHTEGAVLLLAVPGSGKTTVLVTRIGYLIYCKGIPPERILTVTYTVAATADMKRRFCELFGEEYAARLEFRTINGISQRVLQYFGYKTGKTPFDVADKEAVVILKSAFFEVRNSFATENDIRELQTAVTYVKNMRYTEEEIRKYQTPVQKLPEIYQAYQKGLKEKSLIDYDDQMVYALRILQQFPEVRSHFQESYSYFCVDEAQDTSKIQHDMIRLLSEKCGNLFMVGDEDQSIYGFRAAYPEALVDFEAVHPGASVLLMESNYRSGQRIVEAADRFIQKNVARHEKHMTPWKDMEGKVQRITLRNRKAQYEYLLQQAREKKGISAVLYRNHESALPLIDLLEREGIPYRMKGSDMTFFSHPVVGDICDFLRLAQNPYDGEVFLRIYYKMGAGISKAAALEAIENNSLKRTLLQEVAEGEKATPFVRKQCRSLQTHFVSMQKEGAGRAIYRILHFMGYQDYMENHGLDSGKAEILRILGEAENDSRAFLRRLLELQELISTGGSMTKQKPELLLSTIHSSKGLEYDRVFLLDMAEGILPSVQKPPEGKKGTGSSRKAEKDRELYEEERRLFYVAMTRARKELYIFAYEDGSTSSFSREIFAPRASAAGSRGKGIGISCGSRQTYTYDMEEYKEGMYVLHKTFGLGLILKREGDKAMIAFPDPAGMKTISLSVALENGLLRK